MIELVRMSGDALTGKRPEGRERGKSWLMARLMSWASPLERA